MHLLLTRYAYSLSDQWHCFHSDLQPNIFFSKNKFTLWALFISLFCCYHFGGDKYLFWSPVPLPYSPIPQPKQGASSMEDCLNLHGSNVGLQLGLWRVGLSYKPSGQINHLLCAWLPLQYRLSSALIVWVTFIYSSMVHSVVFNIDKKKSINLREGCETAFNSVCRIWTHFIYILYISCCFYTYPIFTYYLPL